MFMLDNDVTSPRKTSKKSSVIMEKKFCNDMGCGARRKMRPTQDYSCPTDLIDGEGVFTFEFGSILCGFGR